MNISDIAKMAGVSSAAVSRYFNNGYISEAKREAIREVVERTGYRPLASAQTLRTKRTMMIGVVAPKMASYSMGQVVDGIQDVLNESSYQMLLAVSRNDREKELASLRAFGEQRVDGIIYIASGFDRKNLSLLKKLKVPLVIVGQRLEGYSCVYHDDYHAVRDMTARVIREGRKNIAYLGVTQTDPSAGVLRRRGWEDAMKAEKLPAEEGHIREARFSLASGYDESKSLLESFPEMDALICATDEIAAGAMLRLQKEGRRIPEDILITGLGASDLARVADHGLCTVRYEFRLSGETAARMILAKLTGEESPERAEQVMLGYRLVCPDRCGAKETQTGPVPETGTVSGPVTETGNISEAAADVSAEAEPDTEAAG